MSPPLAGGGEGPGYVLHPPLVSRGPITAAAANLSLKGDSYRLKDRGLGRVSAVETND